MLASDLMTVFDAILPSNVLMEFVEKAGFQERSRKLDALRLLRAMIIAASTGYGGRQADVLRLYLQAGAERVVRGAFYMWFGCELMTVMENIKDRALSYVAAQDPDLPGWIGHHVTDWVIVDSTTVKIDDKLKDTYMGTGNYAAVKIHKHFSVGIGACIAYHMSSARDHDSIHLTIDNSWKYKGVLLDLAYASIKFLRSCDKHSTSYVIRLKENWKPKVERIVLGTVVGEFLQGSDLDAMLNGNILLLDGKVLDMDVRIGKGRHYVICRLVAIPTPEGYCFYLTNLPRDIEPSKIGDLYRVRWEIESDNKLDKSCSNLDKIGAQTLPALHAMIHASMVSSIIIGLLVYFHRIREAPPIQCGSERMTPPIHPQTLGRAVGSAAIKIAEAMELRGKAAKKRWEELASLLTHLGKDPNWRCRPSILDQIRGWNIKACAKPPRKRAPVLE